MRTGLTIIGPGRLIGLLGLALIGYACSYNVCTDRPDPGLTEEAKSWLEVYRRNPVFVYQNQENQRDTLLVRYLTDTEYCGGDECGNHCELERAILTSKRDTTLRVTVEARLNSEIAINDQPYDKRDSSLVYVGLFTKNKALTQLPAAVQAQYIPDYPVGTEALTVIKAVCTGSRSCGRLRMSAITVSKEKGVIDYVDQRNHRWSLIP